MKVKTNENTDVSNLENIDFNTKYNELLTIVDSELESIIANEIDKRLPQNSLFNAMRYSLMSRGKRLRPVLGLAVAEMFLYDFEKVLPFVCAIEMIHTYSLIHDDLPIMDDDDYRRGMLTNHKVFGEATAILAGDALLNYAFEIMLNDISISKPEDYKRKIDAMKFIAKASGTSGMIAGQIIDLDSEGKKISSSLLSYMHELKTGALIKASVIAPAIICGASEIEISCLISYSENIGLAFQIKDDILDIEGNLSSMGKNTGSDESKNKSTYVSKFGIDESKRKLSDATKRAIMSLDIFKDKATFLIRLAEFIEKRNK